MATILRPEEGADRQQQRTESRSGSMRARECQGRAKTIGNRSRRPPVAILARLTVTSAIPTRRRNEEQAVAAEAGEASKKTATWQQELWRWRMRTLVSESSWASWHGRAASWRAREPPKVDESPSWRVRTCWRSVRARAKKWLPYRGRHLYRGVGCLFPDHPHAEGEPTREENVRASALSSSRTGHTWGFPDEWQIRVR